MTRKTYHHGDLKAVLLRAAEEVLSKTGVEGFSLREVARQVGVSHAAPAHHFGDAHGLLTALSTEGFRRFLQAMRARQATAEKSARAQLIASGLGYIDFAVSAPALFRLMFNSDFAGAENPDLKDACDASFLHLVDDVGRVRGLSPLQNHAAMVDVIAAWSAVQGFAELFVSGRLHPLPEWPHPETEAAAISIIERSVP